MSQCYPVIIYQGISAPGYGKEVVDGINAVDKRYIYQFMSNVQLPGSNIFDSQMQMLTGNQAPQPPPQVQEIQEPSTNGASK